MGDIYASDIRKISGDKFARKVGEVAITGKDGTKEILKGEKLQAYMESFVRGGVSATTIKRHLVEGRMVGSQEKKRAALLRLVTGDDKPKLSPLALRRKERMKKRENIIGGLQSAGMSEKGGGSMAARLNAQRTSIGDKAGRVDKRLNRSLRAGDRKTSFQDIGVKEKEYTGTFLNRDSGRRHDVVSQQGSRGHSSYMGQNTAGGISTIKNTDANAVAGGFGVKKSGPLPGVGGGKINNQGGHIPLSKAA